MRRYRPVLTHAVFWLLFLSVAILYRTLVRHHGAFSLAGYGAEFQRLYTYVLYGRVMVTFYLSLWVFTRFPYPRHLVVIFGQVFLLGVFDSVLSYVLEQRLIGPLTDRWFAEPSTPALVFITDNIVSSWLYVMVAFLVKHVRDHYQTEQLRHEKNALELAYLKSQLNPHFLFNTLNNLYGLALTEPERTPDVVLKLSELMRYMLYESSESHVALAREIDYLRSYIALEALRHEGGFHVDFTVEGLVNGQRIVPLLLIAFVENAFKHGSVADARRPITIRLVVEGARVRFSASNPVVEKQKDQVGGVGLAGVRRRLALLYAGRHRLTVSHDADWFHCALELDTQPLTPARR
jgi:two-component system LytT family sensor kinase